MAACAGRDIDRLPRIVGCCGLRLNRFGLVQHLFSVALAFGRWRTEHTRHIGRNGADILVGDGGEVAHHLRHRSARDAVIGMPAVAQVGKQRVGSPWHRRRRLRIDRISVPVVDVAA